MNNRVLVFDESQNLISKTTLDLEKFLLDRGLFDFSFLTSCNFEEFEKILKSERNGSGRIVLLCDNDKLDECIEAVKKPEDGLYLIDDQAVKLENQDEDFHVLFVPFELEFEKFLDEFLPKRSSFVYSIFGKSRSFVKSKFETIKNEMGCSYEIITIHPFLHKVYCSIEIGKNRIKNDFEQNLYSEKDETLAERLNEILFEKGKTLTVAEFGTAGRISCNLNCDSRILQEIEQLKSMDVTDEMIAGQSAGKEVVFALAKKLLSESKSDLVLAVCDRLSGSEISYVAVGDKEVVHLYSSVFSGELRDRTLKEFAIFRMISFLSEKE